MSGHRTITFHFKSLLKSFNELHGYYNLANSDLGNLLEQCNLLEESNRDDDTTVEIYQKWSFTVSFLQLVNAWQWFFSGILLGRQACLPSQIIQMYYFNIFFLWSFFVSPV